MKVYFHFSHLMTDCISLSFLITIGKKTFARPGVVYQVAGVSYTVSLAESIISRTAVVISLTI